MIRDVRIGTSGWHYPSGAGTWNGVFYPKPRPKAFDELAFYAEFFNTVEINTTFYGQPRPEVAAEWARRTPDGFDFSVKLYQQFTHPKMFRARVELDLSRTIGATDIPDEAVNALIAANLADLDAFRRGIEPLANAGKLGPLLAQFPASFHDTPDNRVHLATLLRAFNEYMLAVELRHRSWSDNADRTRALLDAFGAAWVWIDEPKFKDSVRQQEIEPTSFAYLRMHGRNATAWWQHANRDERYDYLYTADELRPVADRINAVAAASHGVRAYLNNHPSGRSLANAGQLKAMLEQVMPDLPDDLGVRQREAADSRTRR
jgi:uncharacterized protein YecE (DUF72 family)